VQQLNPDFRDILLALRAEGAEFLVVGAYAMGAHGVPRATGDLDLWVGTAADNAGRVYRALASFGAPLKNLSAADLQSPDLIYQVGVVPQRIDVITSIEGVTFAEAFPRRLNLEVGGVPVPVLSRDDLICNKRAAGRPKDVVDVALLEARRTS